MAAKKLSIFINRLVPAYVIDQHPTFVLFLKRFFEYLEQEKLSYDIISNLLDYSHVDTTLVDFEVLFKQQYLKDFPESLAANTSLLVKNIKSFYKSKGTEDSFKFFFRALYGSNIGFYYPRNNILRASAGIWYKPTYLLLQDNNGNIPAQLADSSLLDVNILKDSYITGATTGATAFINKSFYSTYAGTTQNEKWINITEIEGIFENEEQILIGNNLLANGDFASGQIEWENSSADDTNISIVNGKLRISQPADINLVQPRYTYSTFDISPTKDYFLRFIMESSTTDNAVVRIGTIPGANNIYDSGLLGTARNVQLTTILNNAIPANTFSAYISVYSNHTNPNDYVDFDGFTILEVDPNMPLLFITNLGGNSGILNGDFRWYDRQGFLSNDMYLQDNYYYQDYSYEIQSNVNFSDYEPIVEKHLHPAGMRMFGKFRPENIVPDDATLSLDYQMLNIESINIWPDVVTTSIISTYINKTPNINIVGLTYSEVEYNRENAAYNVLWPTVQFFEDMPIEIFDLYSGNIWPYSVSSSITISV